MKTERERERERMLIGTLHNFRAKKIPPPRSSLSPHISGCSLIFIPSRGPRFQPTRSLEPLPRDPKQNCNGGRIGTIGTQDPKWYLRTIKHKRRVALSLRKRVHRIHKKNSTYDKARKSSRSLRCKYKFIVGATVLH